MVPFDQPEATLVGCRCPPMDVLTHVCHLAGHDHEMDQ